MDHGVLTFCNSIFTSSLWRSSEYLPCMQLYILSLAAHRATLSGCDLGLTSAMRLAARRSHAAWCTPFHKC